MEDVTCLFCGNPLQANEQPIQALHGKWHLDCFKLVNLNSHSFVSACPFSDRIFKFDLGVQSVSGNCRRHILRVARRSIARKTTPRNFDRPVMFANKTSLDLSWYAKCYFMYVMVIGLSGVQFGL